jgi:hypothetical protein
VQLAELAEVVAVVVKESILEVILYNLGTVKRGGRIGIILILDSYIAASRTYILLFGISFNCAYA